MLFKTAIEFARNQTDVTYEEWCNLYYDYDNPTPEQIETCAKTARAILIRNKIIDESVGAFPLAY